MAKKKKATTNRRSPQKNTSVTRPNNSISKSPKASSVVRFYHEARGIIRYYDAELFCHKAAASVLKMLVDGPVKIAESLSHKEARAVLASRLDRAFNLMPLGLLVELVIPWRTTDGAVHRFGFHRQPLESDQFTDSILTIYIASPGVLEERSKPSGQDMGRYALVFNTGEVSHV